MIGWDYLGLIDYASGLTLQNEYHRKLKEKSSGGDGFLLLLQHFPVITDGRFGRGGNFLLPEEEIKKKGVRVYRTDRGGDVTFHGPGQLVAYPIINLREFTLGAKSYVRALEETLILLLSEYGIGGERRQGYPGVWTEGSKVASIGVSVKNGITMHGCALNVNTDLGYFSLIVPCGIEGAEVTSMKNLLGRDFDMKAVSDRFVRCFCRVFKVHSERLADP
ncbi:MAG: lipoyl(octanoyl) transferase LipB [Deltaproteobacteria bacterium]